MKIILLITGMGMGGAENQVAALADRFSSIGHKVLLVSLTGETIVRPSDPSVKTVSVGMSKNFFSFIKAIWSFCKIVREFRPDVVHSHMVHANLFARVARLFVRIPSLVCTAHSSNEGGRLRMALYRITDFLADLTTNVSHDGVKRFISKGAVPAHKISMIPNGIDCEKFSHISSSRSKVRSELRVSLDRFVFLAVGRFVPEKDYPNLILAFNLLASKYHNCELWIAGSGPDMGDCVSLVKTLSIGDRIKFLGIRRDIAELMSSCETFVLSSQLEGLPLVVGEAMACGRFVIATDAGGVSEFVGNFGTIVPKRDFAGLSRAMEVVLNLPDGERERLGKQGRQHIQDGYSMGAVVQQWLRIYAQTAGTAPT